MSTSEKEKVVEEHKLCLCCLLPGHRLSKCRSRNRCKVENCDIRHHTLVHEVDLKFIERAKAKRESERVLEVERDPSVSLEGEDSSPRQAVEPHEEYRQSAYTGCETGGCALVEVLPIVVFEETGKQNVMALRDSGCDTTWASRQRGGSPNSRSECAEGVYFPAHQEMTCRTSRKRGSQVLIARCEDNS